MPRSASSVCMLAAALAAGGCAGGEEAAAPRPPPARAPRTSTVAPTAPATTTPTSTTSGAPATVAATTTASVTPPPASCPTVPARLAPRGDRSRYTMRVDVKPAENVVEGEVVVRFTPDLDTDRLVFRLWPNAPRTAGGGARLDVAGVLVGGRPVDAGLENPTTLVARTGAALPAGATVEATVPWRLTLPGAVPDRISRDGDAIRLGSFFPILAWEPGVGWATDPPSSGFAEASTAPAADFTATVNVPAGLDVLATGTNDGSGRWTASAVPDFAISVGRFTLASATVNVPHPVQVRVGVHAGIAEAPRSYLDRITRALEDFSGRYGPYPWPSYTMAVTPVLPGGIEYPMHVLQGPGTVGRTTSHEVAHMWFYGLVANNQGRDPWLDEGLATWAEARFEGTLSTIASTSVPSSGRGRLGEPMTFWESRLSVYYRSVYVQGAQALAALGEADLVDCALRHYVARSAYRVARTPDLLDAARSVFPSAAETLARFGVRV